LRLVETGLGLGKRQIDERIVPRRAFDIAGLAGEIAERAGVDPQRLQPLQRDMRPPFALSRDAKVPEFGRIERARGRRGERGCVVFKSGGDLGSPLKAALGEGAAARQLPVGQATR
jgi:hypothetical protein